MADTIAPEALLTLVEGETPFACIDVREPKAHRCAHIPGASLMPRGLLEFQLGLAVPCTGIPVLVYDDDGRLAARAATILERMGYGQVAIIGRRSARRATSDTASVASCLCRRRFFL